MPQPYDSLSAIIEWEQGDLTDPEDVLELFSHLIRTGQAWSLQGSYGRTAAALIEDGHLSTSGDILSTFHESE